MLASFKVPGLWSAEDMEEIVRDFGVVVVTRSGCDIRKEIYESDLLYTYQAKIHVVNEWIGNDVSSTKIR
ncbi:unnamed protein product [Soboliphyme baturini]|uniref:CTP_transf_like domain-containing protein n=1 Tax=Soboliphyme baturini TaxID=241478 RepID=A0A183IDJ1_9BILA|nr:unnamed protein product [Soboliphyme baturini]